MPEGMAADWPSLSPAEPDVKPIGVVYAHLHGQIPGLSRSLHISVRAIGHYPDPLFN